MHYIPGNLGHLAVIISFVTSLAAFFAYFKASGAKPKEWLKTGNMIYYFHVGAVFAIVFMLYFIISSHYFEYHYAWSHTSRLLPVHFQISSFWEGQEGSFLLWIFWNAILGLVIIFTNRFWTPSVMAVFCLIQAFLTSMIMGVVFFDSIKIGSSPFMLLRDVISAPIFKMNPDYVPEDGNGLNPLLQNYWMVIHPPTLFLGFATTMVPFAFCIAGLWLKKTKEWIRPALPWMQFSVLVLGVGILMGAYWAYETLNFGGYWNWDPVENAIFVPWLVMVAAIHTMIAYKKSEKALKTSVILVVSAFVLIVYSTYLTRSGVLGDSSVHSFTDLGLYGQLLLYLFAFLIGSIWLIIKRWKDIPSGVEEVSAYSREFWIFMGVTVLCLMGFHVIYVTSYPVFNELAGLLNLDLNLAPPTNQIRSYTDIQIWFAVLIALLSGTGQFFWWKKLDKGSIVKEVMWPLAIAALVTGVLLAVNFFGSFNKEDLTIGQQIVYLTRYILLFFSGTYAILANGKVLFSVLKTSPMLSGGSVAHIGIAMMLLGILFSSGYDEVVSYNYTGKIWSSEFPDEVNNDNLLIYINRPTDMGDYSLNYKGMRKLFKEKGYVNQFFVRPTRDPEKYVARQDIPAKKISEGDTLLIEGVENSYFEIDYAKGGKKKFTLFPRVQINEAMGVVYSPDIKSTALADLYTHVRTFPDPESPTEWGEPEMVTAKEGDTFFINDYVATFKSVVRVNEVHGQKLRDTDAAIKAVIEVQGESDIYQVTPYYIIRDRNVSAPEEIVNDLAFKIRILEVAPETRTFKFAVYSTQKDWIILAAVEKPYVNLLWLGTLVLVIGLSIAISRRYREFRLMREKQMEG